MPYIYYIFFILFFGLCIDTSQYRNKALSSKISLYFVPLLIAGGAIMAFRGINVGVDTPTYFVLFSQYSGNFSQIFEWESVEPGWAFLAWVVNFFGGNFLIFQIFFSLIFCCLSFRFLKFSTIFYNDTHYITTVTVFITSIFLVSLNIARQMMAVMFILNAWCSLVMSKRLSTIIYFIGGVSFHLSAVIGFGLFIIWYFRKFKYFKYIAILGLICIYVGFQSIQIYLASTEMGFYDKYINNRFGNFQESYLSKIAWIIVGIHSLYIIFNPKLSSGKNVFVAISCLFCVMTTFLSAQMNYIERIGLFYIPFVSLIYPIVGNSIHSQRIRLIFFSGVAGMYAIWFILGSRSEQYEYSLYF